MIIVSHLLSFRVIIFLKSKKSLSQLGRYPSLKHIYIAADTLMWRLTMMRRYAISLCAHNVYSANHDPPTLKGMQSSPMRLPEELNCLF